MAEPEHNSIRGPFKEITTNPVRTSFWVLILSVFVVTGLTLYLKLYEPAFLKNVLVEAHGMLFDILVIGLFVVWLNEKGKKQIEIQRYKDEIDDFRYWEAPEAAHRIRGNIVRLNKKGISKISLEMCYLKGANLEGANLWGANLREANLHGANLQGANLREANLREANLQGANLQGANLQGANLQEANLQEANLQGANLRGANLGEANLVHANLQLTNLRKADLREANLQGVRNLTIKRLSKVKILYKAELDPELEELIKKKHPHLLEKPLD